MKWGCRGHWGYRGSKAWKITTENFRVTQDLEFSFTLMFWKNNFLVESWNIKLKFSTFSIRGCWGQPMLLFWKLVDETQISKPPKPTMNHKPIKWLILPPFRAELLFTLQNEIPCTRPGTRLGKTRNTGLYSFVVNQGILYISWVYHYLNCTLRWKHYFFYWIERNNVCFTSFLSQAVARLNTAVGITSLNISYFLRIQNFPAFHQAFRYKKCKL